MLPVIPVLRGEPDYFCLPLEFSHETNVQCNVDINTNVSIQRRHQWLRWVSLTRGNYEPFFVRWRDDHDGLQ